MKKDLFLILSEGNPNSLGRVLDVFQSVLEGEITSQDLYQLYQHEDRIVSMRVSNLLKRLWRHESTYLQPLIDRFIKDSDRLKNPTFRWTVAQILKEQISLLSLKQIQAMTTAVMDNLTMGDDWIMLVQSMDCLIDLKSSGYDIQLNKMHLTYLEKDQRKVVKNKFQIMLAKLGYR